MIKTQKGNVVIHTFVGSEAECFVTSHVIEGPSRLVIVDARMLLPFARELRAYIESLGKPVDRVIVTHEHPDHWLGLQALEGWRIVSLPRTAALIEKLGPMFLAGKKKVFGEAVADKVVIPAGTIKPGQEIIDGIRFVFEELPSAEAAGQLLISLPDQGVLVAQDLVFNNVHAYLAQDAVAAWHEQLTDLAGRKGYEVILAGHGEPTGPEALQRQLHYLAEAGKVLAEAKAGTKDVKIPLIAKFPQVRGAEILDISNAVMFGGH